MMYSTKKIAAQFSFYFIGLFLLSGCQRLNEVNNTPESTPQAFLQNQHWITIKAGDFGFIWSQPASTIIVYFVALFTMYAGYMFLRNRNEQQSKLWWGIGLLLTGIGALFAGTSYQALGYEIKCNGREFCTFTSWWEIIYMLLSVPGMNAFLIASACTNTKGNFRKGIIAYAIINTVVYSALLLYGALVPVKFLVSFECLILASFPSVLFLVFMHSSSYAKNKDILNLYLRNAWLIFIAVGFAYALYLSSGITQPLWQRGIWFTENDVLHVGMICWVYYILNQLLGVVKDLE